MIEDRRFALRILSPIHIGCDEVYEPAGFSVDEKEGMLYSFNPIDFLRSLDQQEKERLAAICSKGTIESILELYKFMQGRSFRGHAVGLCPGFLAIYRRTLAMSAGDKKKIQQELNNFTISRTAFNSRTQQPYIPGSAIKGALRTAWLNGRQTVKKLRPAKNPGQLERDLLDGGAFQTDPLRLLKVSDFHPMGKCRTKIVHAINEKKKPSEFKARGPYQTVEVIEPGTVFVGTISVLTPLKKDIIKTPITEPALFESAAQFYGKENARETSELKTAGLASAYSLKLNGGCLLRLGSHSGAESITIEGHRSIRIMKKRGERPGRESGATTFWLAADRPSGYDPSSLAPFGWAAIIEASPELLMEAEKIESHPAAETPITPDKQEAEVLVHEEKPPLIEKKTAAEVLIEELALIKPNDMGRIGTIIQKIETLEVDDDKAAVAHAIRDKISPKAFRKHKRREYLESLITKK